MQSLHAILLILLFAYPLILEIRKLHKYSSTDERRELPSFLRHYLHTCVVLVQLT